MQLLFFSENYILVFIDILLTDGRDSLGFSLRSINIVASKVKQICTYRLSKQMLLDFLISTCVEFPTNLMWPETMIKSSVCILYYNACVTTGVI